MIFPPDFLSKLRPQEEGLAIPPARALLAPLALPEPRCVSAHSGDGRYRKAPLAIDLFCGLGGWTEGLLAEGYYVVGFDIERHQYGDHRYPAHLVIQDVLTLHGSQLKDASLIVASPPCQAYSYRAMPWKRAKALPAPDNVLFEACFRIQREACASGERHIPLIVENVRGAQKWVGRARWNYGSFYLWGDVPALMPMTRAFKSSGMNWSDQTKRGQDFTRIAGRQAMEGIKGVPHRTDGHWTNPAEHEGRKFTIAKKGSVNSQTRDPVASAHGKSRKAASAMIAKIPLPLSRWIGATFYPVAPLAQVGEARRAETLLSGSVHEHAVAESDAP